MSSGLSVLSPSNIIIIIDIAHEPCISSVQVHLLSRMLLQITQLTSIFQFHNACNLLVEAEESDDSRACLHKDRW